MGFRQRLLATLAVPAAVVIVFGVGATMLVGLFERGLEGYFSHEDALAREAGEMYAQGLQTGQAIRNILLEPGNPKAYDNRRAAAEQFSRARERAQAAQSTPKHRELLARVDPLRARHQAAQDRVAALVKEDAAAAAALLKNEETPAWRALKDVLLELKDHASGEMKASREAAVARLAQARWIAAGTALLGFLVCLAAAWSLARHVEREIGGEPDAARRALLRVESGDLQGAIDVRPGDAHSVMAAVRHMQERLVGVVADVRRTAHTVSGESDRITQGNHELSARTEEQASALEQTAATMEQLSATVRQNAESAKGADRLARETAQVALEGGDAVHQVVESMKGMNESSRRIEEIIAVIDGIAFQTNILALNAAVEAARAGEQGRGFAVVASEVRTLAQRSADAAREIKALIEASVERVAQGSAVADRAGETMRRVVEGIHRVAGAVGEISNASAEQSTGVAQVGEAIQQMDHTTQQNAALVEQSASAAESLMRQAHHLESAMSIFRTGEAAAA